MYYSFKKAFQQLGFKSCDKVNSLLKIFDLASELAATIAEAWKYYHFKEKVPEKHNLNNLLFQNRDKNQYSSIFSNNEIEELYTQEENWYKLLTDNGFFEDYL